MINLRPYQSDLVRAIRGKQAEFQRVCAVAPTGSGKTIMFAHLAIEEASSGGLALVLADQRLLVSQAYQRTALHAAERGVRCSIEMSGVTRNAHASIVFASTQTLAGNPWMYRADPTLIIIDEAHRNTLGSMSQGVVSRWPQARVIGFTATPYRSDDKSLADYYQCEVRVPSCSMRALTQSGHLVRVRAKRLPISVDLSALTTGAKTDAQDYSDEELDAIIQPSIDALAHEIFSATHDTRNRVVIYTPSVRTAEMMRDALCRETGTTPDDRVCCFASGQRREDVAWDWHYMSNCSLLTTGWDRPDVDCVCVLRPTKSTSLYSQMLGRGMRPHESKRDLLVLDPLWMFGRHAAHVVSPPDIYSNSGGVILSPSDYDDADSRDADIASGGGDFDALDEADAREDIAARRMAKRLAREKAAWSAREADLVNTCTSLGIASEVPSRADLSAPKPSPDTIAELSRLIGVDRASKALTDEQARAMIDALRSKQVGPPPTAKMLQWLRSPDGRRMRELFPKIDASTHAGAVALRKRSFGLRR